MNATTLYFEDLFASTVALQIHLFLPMIIEKTCYGCRVGSSEDIDHAVCRLPSQDLVRICFQGTLTMIDKDNAEAQFRSYVYPRPDSIFEESWFQNLWLNADWMKLVQDKVIELRQQVMNL